MMKTTKENEKIMSLSQKETAIFRKTKKIITDKYMDEKNLRNLIFRMKKEILENKGDAITIYSKICKDLLPKTEEYLNFKPDSCLDGIKKGDAVSTAVGISYYQIFKYAIELDII